MNFSFWPFLWFGLPGRLLTSDGVEWSCALGAEWGPLRLRVQSQSRRLSTTAALFRIFGFMLVLGQFGRAGTATSCSDFLFPLQPAHPPYPDKPPARPTAKSLISVHFGSVSALFRLRLALFRVCFGSVSGLFRDVGWGRGGVGERGFCKGKAYH